MSDLSRFAERYAAPRPKYPTDRYRYLAGLTPDRSVARDCATGNGQGLRPRGCVHSAPVVTDRGLYVQRNDCNPIDTGKRVVLAQSLDGVSETLRQAVTVTGSACIGRCKRNRHAGREEAGELNIQLENDARTESISRKSSGEGSRGELSTYLRFGAMIGTSTVVMFALTYTNSYSFDHVRWSEERFYMALLMGAAMAIVMLGFMWSMHRNVKVNLGIIAGAVMLVVLSLWLSRSQYFVDDQAYMRGMIPHHSIAILTSERADIDDVRVRELADEIIEAQRREIKEMDWLIDDIADNGLATTDIEARERPVPDFSGSD